MGLFIDAEALTFPSIDLQDLHPLFNAAPLCHLADLAPGRQKGKHGEHALSVSFQHRDGAADHL